MGEQFKPFEKIGLCFSGGGYRATFFALGVASYLNKIKFKETPLLHKVEAMSSVSGGTLFAAAYAKATQDKEFNFDTFYKKFYSVYKPESDNLLGNAVSKLEDDKVWKENPHKKRSLINAFALAYSDLGLYNGNFDMFMNAKHSNLKNICFNATEFSNGLAFRFQNTGKFGNNPLYCKELNKIKGDINLSDIVASSSCFPMGFEPLLFPDDYFKNKKDAGYKDLKRLEKFSNGVGIMDGGIVDNQGIGSMININKTKEAEGFLDLIIVNDVGSYKMEPWKSIASKSGSKKTLKDAIGGVLKYLKFNWIYWATLLVGVSILIGNSLELIKNKPWDSLYILGGIISGIGIVLTLFGAFISLVKKSGINWIRAKFNKIIPSVLLDDVLSFQKLETGLLKNMIADRMTSTMKMVSDVFLKQIRRLNYNLLYAKENQNKIISSMVYQLDGQETVYKEKNDFNESIKPSPSEQLKRIALIASEAPTTLWWDEKDISNNRMDSLIACGQFTTCYNLMDYISKIRKIKEINLDGLDNMYSLLEKDWKEFNKEPLNMV